jgi:hypothetical protein
MVLKFVSRTYLTNAYSVPQSLLLFPGCPDLGFRSRRDSSSFGLPIQRNALHPERSECHLRAESKGATGRLVPSFDYSRIKRSFRSGCVYDLFGLNQNSGSDRDYGQNERDFSQ